MFDLANWRNPETLLLNITNGVLGVVTVVLILWILSSAIHERMDVDHRSNTKH